MRRIIWLVLGSFEGSCCLLKISSGLLFDLIGCEYGLFSFHYSTFFFSSNFFLLLFCVYVSALTPFVSYYISVVFFFSSSVPHSLFADFTPPHAVYEMKSTHNVHIVSNMLFERV